MQVSSIQPNEPLGLMIVVVLYKMPPGDSTTLRSLLALVPALPPETARLSVLLWDNTPGGQQTGPLPSWIRYRSAPENPGLAAAYNAALSIAAAEGCSWMLTLDHDTAVPDGFLVPLAALARRYASQPSVAAIVPRVIDGSTIISPYRMVAGAIPVWSVPPREQRSAGLVYAVNSGALWKVSTLQEMGGYDSTFPLDFSDINMFHKLYLAGKQVVIAGTLTLQHQLAILDKAARMSPERYKAILLDECAFYDLHINMLGRLERLLRLAVRALRDSSPGMLPYRQITLHELRRRLTTFRSERLRQWRAWVEAGRRLPSWEGR